MFRGNNAKYEFFLVLVLFGTPYIIILFLTVIQIDPVFMGYFWVFYIVFFIFMLTVLPLREYKIHQGATFGKTFTFGPIVYLNHTTRNVLLGHEGEIEEIQMRWEDEELKVKERSKLYMRARRIVLKNETLEEKETRQMYNTSEDVEALVKGLEYNPSAPPLLQIAQRLSDLYNIKVTIPETAFKQGKEEGTPEKEPEEPPDVGDEVLNEPKTIIDTQFENEDQDENETPKLDENFDLEAFKKKMLLQSPGEIPKTGVTKKETFLKLETLDSEYLASLGFTSKEQKRRLEEMNIYKVDLYHSETLEGYESVEFSQVFYILPGSFEEILKTSEMEVVDYAEYTVKVQCCEVMWCCLGFINGKIPLLLCMSSENMIQFQNAEVIKSSKMMHSAIYYLRLKIQDHLIDEFQSEQEIYMTRLDTLEHQNEGLRKRYDWLTQEYLADNFIRAPPSVQRELAKKMEENAELKKWKPIAIIFVVMSFILLFAIFFVVLPLIGGSGANEPEPRNASLVNSLFRILIYQNNFLTFIKN